MASRQEIADFMASEFPQARTLVEEVADRHCRLRYPVAEGDLRPGGTVSGPTMMALADTALYVAILATIGIVPLAVTTSLNINFTRKPLPGKDLVGVCRLIKVGRVLIVGDVMIYSEGQEEPVAHATGTYSVPPVP